MENLTKVCTKCDLRKPIYEYARKASSLSGIQNICKECDKQRNRIWRIENPEKEKAKSKRHSLGIKKVEVKSNITEILQPKITEVSQSNINSIQSYLNSNQMEFKTVKINPEIASVMLKGNDSNRSLSKRHVSYLAVQMEKGQWQSNGECIKISKTGRLLDGQHRLMAIVQSGMTIEMIVISNLDDSIFSTLDTGKTRSAGDILDIANIPYGKTVAGAIRLIHLYTNGNSLQLGGNKVSGLSNSDILEFEKTHELSRFSTLVSTLYEKNRIITPAQFLFLHFLFNKIDKDDCSEFLEKLASGTNLSEKHPVKVLRDKILKHKSSSLKLPVNQLYYIIFKAWNYFRESKEVTSISLYSADNKPLILK